MKRRVLLGTGFAAFALPKAWAQSGPALRRVGLLTIADGGPMALVGALAELGVVDGRDIVIELRSAKGRTDDLPRLAAELVALKPLLIVSVGPQATQAALAADPAMPVVALLGAAVELGLAAQLARPGGRLTGVSFLGTPLNAKRLELLSELLPKGRAFLNLGDPGTRSAALVDALAAASRNLHLATHDVAAGTPQEIDAAFAMAGRLRVSGVNVLGSPFLDAHRLRIVALAAKARLPAIYQWPRTAHEGGLMAYGPSQAAMNQLLAGMVVRVLGGSKPGDLPIEQPTRFELVINMKVARALGLSVPQSLLLRADEVIE
jgi:putative tryptophan/tyrosine transport system substrate-binding protein